MVTATEREVGLVADRLTLELTAFEAGDRLAISRSIVATPYGNHIMLERDIGDAEPRGDEFAVNLTLDQAYKFIRLLDTIRQGRAAAAMARVHLGKRSG